MTDLAMKPHPFAETPLVKDGEYNLPSSPIAWEGDIASWLDAGDWHEVRPAEFFSHTIANRVLIAE